MRQSFFSATETMPTCARSGKKVFKIGKPTFSGTKSCDKCAEVQAPIKLIIVADGETGQLKLNIEPCGAATTAA
jgi:hypothetical protein